MAKRARRYHSWVAANWPDADRAAWQAANADGDGLTSPGRLKAFKPRTVDNAELAWGRYLDFQRQTGTLIENASVSEKLNKENLVAFGRELLKTLTLSTALCIFMSMKRAARVLDPNANTGSLNEIARRLAKLAKPTREIDARLISPPDLVAVAEAMMNEADAISPVSYRSRLLYRDGLLILWETLCPLRRGTMAEIKIGEHLIFEGDVLRIELGEELMKGNRPFAGDLPKPLEGRVRRYVEAYRPYCLKTTAIDSGYLFVSSAGGRLFPGTLSRIVKDRIMRRTDINFSFHLFRHCAASFIAEKAPHRLEAARLLLHHRRPLTTWKHYVRNQQSQAMGRYQAAVKATIKRQRRRRAKK